MSPEEENAQRGLTEQMNSSVQNASFIKALTFVILPKASLSLKGPFDIFQTIRGKVFVREKAPKPYRFKPRAVLPGETAGLGAPWLPRIWLLTAPNSPVSLR